ncbi:MAG: DUF2784 domain-containing protein, partial [Deltaproteobacteria bacterium]|nr:DUF2784 domain-containing protein [Deltaproteobacteria bacterium]
CPLTPLERWLLQADGQTGYSGGFIEHYLLPVLYPSALSREIQILLGISVVVINITAYGWLIAGFHKRSNRNSRNIEKSLIERGNTSREKPLRR